MGRQRDPNRDKAKEIYIASKGEINLIDIATQLRVSDGTVRGWKAKDKWDLQLNDQLTSSSKKVVSSKSGSNGTERNKERDAPKNQSERSNNTERSKKKTERNESAFELTIENDELTDKQRLFCIYYIKSFNATQAAMKAGYSRDTAHIQGPRLLSNVKIATEIKRLKANVANAIHLDIMDVLNKYIAIAFADITDYVEFGQQDVPITTKKGPVIGSDGNVMTVKQSFVALRFTNEVDGAIISEIKEGRDGVSVKLHDKMKALEVLTRYFDLLPDNHKRMIEEEKLKLDKERFEFEKVKAAGEGDLDEELIDDWVEAVMDDGEDGGDQQETGGIQETDSDIS